LNVVRDFWSATMNEQNRAGPSLGRCILAGLIAGAVSTLLANLAALILARQFNRTFDELNWLSISRASMISCFAGAFVYAALLRWTKHPVIWFTIGGLAVATLDSVFVAMHPPVPGIERIANPLHFVVAIVALILIPILAPAIPQPGELHRKSRENETSRV
jgi:hypothetical protein